MSRSLVRGSADRLQRGWRLRCGSFLDGKDDLPRNVDPALLKAMARTSRWFEKLARGHVRSLAEIARREKLQKGYVNRLTRLAFVAPRIVDAVARGRAPAGPSLQMLMTSRVALPLEWKERARLLDFK